MPDPYETPEQDHATSDAVPENWVDIHAPNWARPYLRLTRADRPIGTWLLLIPCWWGLILASVSQGAVDWRQLSQWFILFAVGAFLMRGAGCTWNDITDRDLDAQVARTKSRPLPAGQVTPKQAYIWMLVQIALSALILLEFPPFAVIVAFASLLPVIIYPFAKRFTWWPQAFLGIAFNWGALLSWSVVTGELSLAPILLYAAGISWTLFYDTIYAHQDKEDDALIGIKSTARLFQDNTKRWLMGFLILTLLLMMGAFLVALPDNLNPLSLVIGIMGIWGFGIHMTWQIRKLDADDAENCLKLFRSNRDAGLIPVAGFILCAGLASVLSLA